MDEFAQMAAREREATRIARRQWFWLHLAVYVPLQVMLFSIWNAVDAQFPLVRVPASGLGDPPRRTRGLRLRDEDSGGDHDRARAAKGRYIVWQGVRSWGGPLPASFACSSSFGSPRRSPCTHVDYREDLGRRGQRAHIWLNNGPHSGWRW